MNLFLTGTDTNVGKTYVAALLVAALRRNGLDCVAMKPICCGERRDAEVLHAVCDGRITLNEVNPVWLRAAAAPSAAAMIENRVIDLAEVKETFARLCARHDAVIVEGVGGWRVPITDSYFVSDLAIDLGLDVAVVVANRLGALNHTLLTVESIRACGGNCVGLILNDIGAAPDFFSVEATATNAAVLESLVRLPILYRVEHAQTRLIL
jgi:dethiobiotin synthetase